MGWGYFDSETLRTLVLEWFRTDLLRQRKLTPEPIPATQWDHLQDAVGELVRRHGLYPDRAQCPDGVDHQWYASGKLNPLDLRTLMAVTWSLIFEGVLSPGASAGGSTVSGWPFVELTHYGKGVLDGLEPSPHDTDGYLGALDARIPSLGAASRLYVGEALGCFRRGLFLGAAVMIGVVVEAALDEMADGLIQWLPESEGKKLGNSSRGRSTAQLAQEIRKRLEPRKKELPEEYGDLLSTFSFLADVIRRTRNDAGHPTGKAIERRTILVLLTALPAYLEFAYGLADWLRRAPRSSG